MRYRPARLCLIALLAGLAMAGPAAGQRSEDDRLARLQTLRADELIRARRLRADAQDAADAAERLALALARTQPAGPGLSAGQAERRARLAEREAALAEAAGRDRLALTQVLAALQRFRRDPPPVLLTPPEVATRAIRGQILLKAVEPELRRRTEVLSERSRSLEAERRALALEAAAAYGRESEAADRRGEIERQLAASRALAASLMAEARSAEFEADALGRRIRALGAEPRALTAEDARAPVAATPGPLAVPEGARRISGFSPASPGLIFALDPGAAVTSPAAGTVDYAGPLEGWGEVVIIQPRAGWRLVLAGLDRAEVATGARIQTGQRVGRMAADGRGRLYLELRRGTEAVDPANWLDARDPG